LDDDDDGYQGWVIQIGGLGGGPIIAQKKCFLPEGPLLPE